jgi:hypothetical protein
VRIRFEPDLRASRGKLRSGGSTGTPVHAGSFLNQREIVLEEQLIANAPELVRILVHELFHFVWRRLDNASRAEWAELLDRELRTGVCGELGWSAEGRRRTITSQDRIAHTRRWREYVCESFCDTAAWLFSPRVSHEECTLPDPARAKREAWFRHLMEKRKLPL